MRRLVLIFMMTAVHSAGALTLRQRCAGRTVRCTSKEGLVSTYHFNATATKAREYAESSDSPRHLVANWGLFWEKNEVLNGEGLLMFAATGDRLADEDGGPCAFVE